jgi:hypothetical protein
LERQLSISEAGPTAGGETSSYQRIFIFIA